MVHLVLNQCRAPSGCQLGTNGRSAFWWLLSSLGILTGALDPCLFHLALNLGRATNASGRIFVDRNTAALMFFKTKGEKKMWLRISRCLCGSLAPPIGGRQEGSTDDKIYVQKMGGYMDGRTVCLYNVHRRGHTRLL